MVKASGYVVIINNWMVDTESQYIDYIYTCFRYEQYNLRYVALQEIKNTLRVSLIK